MHTQARTDAAPPPTDVVLDAGHACGAARTPWQKKPTAQGAHAVPLYAVPGAQKQSGGAVPLHTGHPAASASAGDGIHVLAL
jgi:hypothetical protein